MNNMVMIRRIDGIYECTQDKTFAPSTNLNVSVVAGDYIEIKGVQPTWVTNPLTTIYQGHIYIE